MDFYMKLLENEDDEVLAYPSHFYTTLAAHGHRAARKYEAKNVNIFDKGLLIIPVKKSNHWSVCVSIQVW